MGPFLSVGPTLGIATVRRLRRSPYFPRVPPRLSQRRAHPRDRYGTPPSAVSLLPSGPPTPFSASGPPSGSALLSSGSPRVPKIKKGGCQAALEFTLIPSGPIEESSESPAPAGVTQLPKRLCFDLADTFAGHGKVLSDFFECMFRSILKTKAHLDHAFLARHQCIEHLFRHFLQVDIDHRIGGRDHATVLDEISKVRIFLFTDRSLQRDRLLCDFHDLPDFRNGDIHPLRDFLTGRFAAEFLNK